MTCRNHPYFLNQQPTINKPVQVHPNMIVDTYPGYNPRLAEPETPRWFNNQEFVMNIGALTRETGYNSAKDGYRIGEDGYIYQPSTDNDANGGVIAAMAIASEKEYPHDIIIGRTHIINTEDAGLRHVHINKDGSVMDIGPVESACIVGNIDRPEGIYIPMCNTRAMVDGAVLLDNLIHTSMENDTDVNPNEFASTFIVDEIASLPAAPFEEGHHHECSCGGECKCKKNKK